MNIFILDIGKSWIISIFRSLFAFFDFIVYSVISILFKTMFQLANFELVGFYESMQQRVYVILGIFMLFKVTVSLISYLVNPDKISDKEQGASKLITRIMTVLVMLIALPNAFALMTEFQNKLIPVIPRIVIGTSFSTNESSSAGENAGIVGDSMAVTMLNGFAHVKDECRTSSNPAISSPGELLVNINNTCKIDGESRDIYAYDYLPIVSTLVGVIMCYVIISLNISVAIRAFKLIILRMLAPIPVISYIDPKSSKDGMFSTWLKTFLSVWAELFIFIGLIYFIVYMIDFLLSTQAWAGFFSSTDLFGGVIFLSFILVGLLFFAKQAPKFIFDALGIKSKGNFIRMLGMGAAAVGTVGGGVAGFNGAIKNGSNPLSSILSGVGGALGSGLNSGKLLFDKDSNPSSVLKGIRSYNDKLYSNLSDKSTAGGRLLAGFENTIGLKNQFQRYEDKTSDYNAATAAWKRIETALNSDDDRINGAISIGSLADKNKKGLTIKNTGELIFDATQSYTVKQANDIVTRMKASGQYSASDIETAEDILKNIQSNRFDNIRKTTDPSSLHGTASQIYQAAETIYDVGKKYANDEDQVFAAFAGTNGVKDNSLAMSKDFKGAAYNADREADAIKNSTKYAQAEANANRVEKNK